MTAEIVPIQPTPAKQAEWIGQATAVEQARAVAEVQAAVVVAQSVPRDMDRAINEMRDTCGRLALANRAFYSVSNRGNGPSVHLARELARIWGNVQYGVHELRQDLAGGTSEVQAFSWDVQTNTRSTRTFIVAHARMKGGKQQKLTDLGDIYLSNQNVGARAVRECIFSVLPTWFSDEAQDRCRATLEHGEGKPLPQRISDMVAAFSGIGVTLPQLEGKIGRKRGAWNASDVAQMAITFTSITRDGLDKAEVFPSNPVTAAEILAPPANAPLDRDPLGAVPEVTPVGQAASWTIPAKQVTSLQILAQQKGFRDREQRLSWASQVVEFDLQSFSDLTTAEAATLRTALDELPDVDK